MSDPARRPPIFVIGMHRSGTTMVARLLDELGVFMGWRLQGDHEPIFVVRLNDWLFSQCGGAWDRPLAIRDLVECAPARELAVEYLRAQLAGPRAASFLGPGRYLRHGGVGNLPGAWGWKDPRFTFTLPLWLDLFPDARVLHISRHGVDVADSLRRRHETSLSRRRERFRRDRLLAGLVSKRAGFTTSLRVATFEGGLGLWEEYMAEASRHVDALGSRALSVKYEDFLADPEPMLGRIAAFCDIAPGEAEIARAARMVRPDRAYSFLQSPETLALARQNLARLGEFDYGA
jgi:hypothetical protein